MRGYISTAVPGSWALLRVKNTRKQTLLTINCCNDTTVLISRPTAVRSTIFNLPVIRCNKLLSTCIQTACEFFERVFTTNLPLPAYTLFFK